jgi:hypothetical protein
MQRSDFVLVLAFELLGDGRLVFCHARGDGRLVFCHAHVHESTTGQGSHVHESASLHCKLGTQIRDLRDIGGFLRRKLELQLCVFDLSLEREPLLPHGRLGTEHLQRLRFQVLHPPHEATVRRLLQLGRPATCQPFRFFAQLFGLLLKLDSSDPAATVDRCVLLHPTPLPIIEKARQHIWRPVDDEVHGKAASSRRLYYPDADTGGKSSKQEEEEERVALTKTQNAPS